MEDAELRAALAAISESLAGLAYAVAHLQASAAPLPPPEVPAAAQPVPKRVYHYNDKGLLADSEGVTHLGGVDGPRVDPIVDGDCPTVVYIPGTHHYLSVARPDLGERFTGYCIRTSKQANGNVGRVGSLAILGDALHAPYGGYKVDGSNWPQVADAFFNPNTGEVDPRWAADEALRASRAAAEQAKPAPGPMRPPQINPSIPADVPIQ